MLTLPVVQVSAVLPSPQNRTFLAAHPEVLSQQFQRGSRVCRGGGFAKM